MEREVDEDLNPGLQGVIVEVKEGVVQAGHALFSLWDQAEKKEAGGHVFPVKRKVLAAHDWVFHGCHLCITKDC